MNFDIWDALIVGFYLGAGVGWWFNRKPPIVKVGEIKTSLVIDQTALDKIEQARVFAWLDRRGLTWMAKGAVFDPNKVVKK
jgi:hypothetical protein